MKSLERFMQLTEQELKLDVKGNKLSASYGTNTLAIEFTDERAARKAKAFIIAIIREIEYQQKDKHATD